MVGGLPRDCKSGWRLSLVPLQAVPTCSSFWFICHLKNYWTPRERAVERGSVNWLSVWGSNTEEGGTIFGWTRRRTSLVLKDQSSSQLAVCLLSPVLTVQFRWLDWRWCTGFELESPKRKGKIFPWLPSLCYLTGHPRSWLLDCCFACRYSIADELSSNHQQFSDATHTLSPKIPYSDASWRVMYTLSLNLIYKHT